MSQVTTVDVEIGFEAGCDPEDGEYRVCITGIDGELDIYPGNQNDISLVQECIAEYDFSSIPKDRDGHVQMRLKESGEWEDCFWHKYFVIESEKTIFY